ncbi:MAG: DUF1802 family protein [Planctomycetaceae bacterium]
MQPANRHALKEWAAICHALRAGRQTLLLRSGGIADSGAGFQVEHDEFWLFATRFHQSADELAEDAAPFLEAVSESSPPHGMVRLPLYATVEQVHHIHNADHLARLAGQHILAPQTVLNRFHYRQPGLTVLVIRAHVPPCPIELHEAEHFAGCHSWVELPSALPTDDVQPVLAEDDFATRAETIAGLLATLQ